MPTFDKNGSIFPRSGAKAHVHIGKLERVAPVRICSWQASPSFLQLENVNCSRSGEFFKFRQLPSIVEDRPFGLFKGWFDENSELKAVVLKCSNDLIERTGVI